MINKPAGHFSDQKDQATQSSQSTTAPMRIGVVFGSRSVEHEVSIITATQLMRNFPASYQAVPLYIDKSGRWWTGKALAKIETFQQLDLHHPDSGGLDLTQAEIFPVPQASTGVHQMVDAIILAVHGGAGEDGTLAGLLELAGIPYVGPGVIAAGAAIDKIFTKHLAESAGLKVTNYGWFTSQDWQHGNKAVLAEIDHLNYPLFVKPVSLGSSVGITRVTNQNELIAAIELAAEFDSRIVVEESAPADVIEVNVAVLGTADDCQASISEQPVKTEDFLTYADKYQRGGKKTGEKTSQGMAGLSRQIPAPISLELQEKMQDAACYLWKLIDGFGVARIDFFANPTTEEFWVGEINSPPGSMAYYLWEASGLNYPKLIEQLIKIAQQRFEQRKKLFTSIETNILAKK